MKKFNLFLIVILMALVFAPGGCEQQAKEIDTALTGEDLTEEIIDPPAFTGSVSSSETGPIAKGAARQFIADTDAEVNWTVTGGSSGGGTMINKNGLLTVGKNEAGITLVVRAKSETVELGTAGVKVKGWKDITANLSGIFSTGSGMGAASSTGITAAAYGNGIWVIAGNSVDDWDIPAVAWSDDEGGTWHDAGAPLDREEHIGSIVYDGPADNKRFVIGGHLGCALYSTDGKTWTKTARIFPAYGGGGGIGRNPLRSLVYGEVEGGGIYITVNSGSDFAWSEDGASWTLVGQAIEGSTSALACIAYGSGLVNGERVNMFRGWSTTDPAIYSITGKSWTPLTQEEADAQRFIPIVPNSGYGSIAVQAMDTKATTVKGGMFTEVFTGDWAAGSTASLYTNWQYVPCPDDNNAYIYRYITGVYKRYAYKNYVIFVVPGGGKYLAVGAGPRAAIAHAEAFE